MLSAFIIFTFLFVGFNAVIMLIYALGAAPRSAFVGVINFMLFLGIISMGIGTFVTT